MVTQPLPSATATSLKKRSRDDFDNIDESDSDNDLDSMSTLPASKRPNMSTTASAQDGKIDFNSQHFRIFDFWLSQDDNSIIDNDILQRSSVISAV